jgi:hypothetical protein
MNVDIPHQITAYPDRIFAGEHSSRFTANPPQNRDDLQKIAKLINVAFELKIDENVFPSDGLFHQIRDDFLRNLSQILEEKDMGFIVQCQRPNAKPTYFTVKDIPSFRRHSEFFGIQPGSHVVKVDPS